MKDRKKVKSEVAKCGDGLRGGACTNGGGIFLEQRIFGAMQLVFNGPVVTVIGE